MSTENIFGGWNNPSVSFPKADAMLQTLWHALAAQTDSSGSIVQANSGLSQRKHEIMMLWKLFLWANPKVVVEIGVAQGGTFASWCALADPSATLIAIDRDLNDCRPRPGDPVNPIIASPATLKLSRDGGGVYHLAWFNQKVVGITGWSYAPHVLEELKLVLAGRKVDWLWHDASHEANMARRDYELYRPFMAPGSIMAFHDIQESKVPECNKSEWWAQVKRDGDYSACFEFRGSKSDDSMGIGVLIF